MNVLKLKIAELKKALKERGLATTGIKADLVARLKAALVAEGTDTALQDDDIEAKESELLAEEEDEENTSAVETELDPKLLDTPVPAPKPKKIVINRELAASAQQAANTAIAQQEQQQQQRQQQQQQEAAVGTPVTPSAAKRIKLTGPSNQQSPIGSESQSLNSLKILTPEERKAARLAKFAGGTPAPTSAPAPAPVAAAAVARNGAADPLADVEKLKKRAGRFGESVSQKVISMEEVERLRKRKERFGIVVPEEAKAKRAARFAATTPTDAAAEDKKRLRAARFGTT